MTRRRAWMRTWAPVSALALVLGTASPSNAEAPRENSPSLAAKTLDLVLIKPASLVRTLLGGLVVAVTYPLFFFSGDAEDILDIAVRDPMKDATERPLGDF